RLRIEELHIRPGGSSDRTDDLIDTGIGAKAQSVEVARANVAIFCISIIAQLPLATSDAELQFGKLIIDLRRRVVGLQGVGIRPDTFQGSPLLHERCPGL